MLQVRDDRAERNFGSAQLIMVIPRVGNAHLQQNLYQILEFCTSTLLYLLKQLIFYLVGK